MEAYLEVWLPEGARRTPLHGQQVTIGRDADNGLALPVDELASGQHAVLTRYPAGWCIRDFSSTNGTHVNGRRILGEHPLWHGDEIRVGNTRIVYRMPAAITRPRIPTGSADTPELTPRERAVLLALCRPVLNADAFTEPASVRGIAQELVVTTTAVKHHLSHLYRKFGIDGREERRRVLLANAAVRTGAINLGDLRGDADGLWTADA